MLPITLLNILFKFVPCVGPPICFASPPPLRSSQSRAAKRSLNPQVQPESSATVSFSLFPVPSGSGSSTSFSACFCCIYLYFPTVTSTISMFIFCYISKSSLGCSTFPTAWQLSSSLLSFYPNHLNLTSLTLSPNYSTTMVPRICSILNVPILIIHSENLKLTSHFLSVPQFATHTLKSDL